MRAFTQRTKTKRVGLLVDALRSDKFEQTSGYLEVNGQNCCLGVACRVAEANGLRLKVAQDNEGYAVAFDGSTSVLPDSVMRWFGFESENPMIEVNTEIEGPTAATIANDARCLSFSQIADGFEKTYGGSK